MSSSSEAPADKNIDRDEVVKKEARGIDDADFGEVQLNIQTAYNFASIAILAGGMAMD